MSNEGVGGQRRKSARILALEEKEKEKRKSSAANANNTNDISSSKDKANLTGNVPSFQYQQLQHCGATAMQPSPFSPLKRGRKQKRLEDLAVLYLDQSKSQQDGEDSKDGNPSTKIDQQLTGSPSMPERRFLGVALNILQRRDTNGIFAQPVNPEEVETYYSIIKEPMDFGTMRTKLEEGKYTSLEQFEHDVFLVSSNAMHFNSSTTIYYKEARAMQGLAQAVFYTLRTDPEKLESEFSLTRGRPGRKSSRVVETRGPSSRHPRQTGVKIGASLLGPRDRGDSALPKRESPQFYRPWNSFRNENETLVSSVYNSVKTLTEASEKGEYGYKQSLVRFVKGLGPTAKKVAAMKLMKCLPHAQTSTHTAQRLLLPAPSFLQNTVSHNAQFPIASLQNSTGSPNVLHGRNTFLNLNVQASPNDLMPPPKAPKFSQARHDHLLGKMPMLDNNVANTTTNFNLFGSPSRENGTCPSDNMTANFQGTTYLRQKAVVPQQEVVENQEGQCWLASHLKVIPVEDSNSPNGKKFVTVDMMADNHPDTDELSVNWRSRLRSFVHRGNIYLKSINLFPSRSESSGSSSAQGMVNGGANPTAQAGQSSEGFGLGSDFATLQMLLTNEYTPLPSYDELGVVHGRDGNSADHHGQVGINLEKRVYLKDIENEPDLSLQL